MSAVLPVPPEFEDPLIPPRNLPEPLAAATGRYVALCVPLRLGAGVFLAVQGAELSRGAQDAVLGGLTLLFFFFSYTAVAECRRAAGSGAWEGAGCRRRSWKNYPRAALALAAALAAAFLGRWDVAGALIAADGLIGLSSRHTFGAMQALRASDGAAGRLTGGV